MENQTIEHAPISSEWMKWVTKTDIQWPLITIFSLLIMAFLTSQLRSKEPWSLSDPVPRIYNTVQFLTNNEKFMNRVMVAMKDRNIAKFFLGPQKVYLIAGPQHMKTIFGRGHQVGSEDVFVQAVLPILYKMPKKDVQRFANDKSGRGKIPAPGTEATPPSERYWHQYEHIHTEYLARTQHLKPIIQAFRSQFSIALEKYPLDEWTTVGVTNLCRREVAKCAMSTLLGPKVFDLNTDFLDAFWEFDDNVFTLTLGFPEWLNPKPYRVQDKYLAMIEKYVDAAMKNFDWKGPDAEVNWEPHFGARICRETAKWLKEGGFPDTSIAGALGTLLFAQNSNVIPTTMWMIIEVFKDSSLLEAVREEITTTYVTDPETIVRNFDVEKLVKLPLLQSIFTEVLRLHMNFNVIRHVKEPLVMDGFTLGKGSMLQAPMMVAHYDEAVWGSAGHPASEFWPERHLKYVKDEDDSGKVTQKRVFSMAGRPSSYFPFGGGGPVCPGRHFAKHEIFTTVAVLISKFEIEFAGWTKLDGSPSDRAAQNDQIYCGAGCMPPDRDMKMRMKRIG